MRHILALLFLGFVVFFAMEVSERVDLPLLSGKERAGCPEYPHTRQELANTIGGAQERWVNTGERSWKYLGSDPITFKVPDDCVVTLSTGTKKRAGDWVVIKGGEKIMWSDTA